MDLVNTNLVSLSGFNTSTNLNNNSFNIGVSTNFYNLANAVRTSLLLVLLLISP